MTFNINEKNGRIKLILVSILVFTPSILGLFLLTLDGYGTLSLLSAFTLPLSILISHIYSYIMSGNDENQTIFHVVPIVAEDGKIVIFKKATAIYHNYSRGGDKLVEYR